MGATSSTHENVSMAERRLPIEANVLVEKVEEEEEEKAEEEEALIRRRPPPPPRPAAAAAAQQELRPRTRLWHMFGRRVPRSEIVFCCQTLLVYVVAVTSLVNITLSNGPLNLWIALLSSSLGYLLPHPSLDKTDRRRSSNDVYHLA